ncbi:MAG: N-acetylmuramidase family protein [Muribaculaceae bacterium]|nr:N-acetylmuramidase family protein [Muribaculaceae bacterium]
MVTHLPVDDLPVERDGSGQDFVVSEGDTVWLYSSPEERSGRLTERDYEEVAAELGVEIAAIKAVVEIEAGRTQQGFWSEGHPVINFDLTVFRRMAQRNKVSLGKYSKSHSVVFARPDARRYGSQQAAQQARLDAAMEIDSLTAIQGTFWGMFQIGGFNWKKCGAASPEEFVRLMSRSERDQLELFAEFIVSSGLLPSLKKRDWRRFASGYNGPGYASRGYHTKLANAYARYKK